MTLAKREVASSMVFGSYGDDRSYAMMFTSGEQSVESDSPSNKTPDSPFRLPDSKTPDSLFRYSTLPDRLSPDSADSGAALTGVEVHPMGPSLSRGAVNPVALNSVAEELMHASDMSVDKSIGSSHRSNDSNDSNGRGGFTDIGEESYNFTTSTLRKCKHQVLKPYWGLLMFIGWRVFRHDVIAPRSGWLRVLNVTYPLLIVLLLLYTYMYEMVACEWRLDVKQDTLIVTSPATPAPTPHNSTPRAVPFFSLNSAIVVTPTTTAGPVADTEPQACEHIVTTYLIPNILHFIAYIMGLYYFRIQDNEQIYALMEKVFLQADPLKSSSSSQKKLIAKTRSKPSGEQGITPGIDNTRMFLLFGSAWVLLTLGLQGLYVWSFDFPRLAIFERYGPVFHWTTFAIELVGRIVFNSVLVAVVMNYATQCEMLMFYVKGLTLRLQEKSVDIKKALKDVLLLRQSLSTLNGVISKMTSLALVILAELTIIGLSILALNRYNEAKVWAYRSVFPLVWAIMLSFPLFQAARVNSVCLRIKKMSLEMRVFGFLNSSQLELDSFVQFVHCTTLKAKLFHIPILPSYIIAVSVLVAFIFLILVQTSLVGPRNYII